MPDTEASETELRERLTAILRATPLLMRVLTVSRGLDLLDWLVFSGAVYQPVLNHLTGRAPDYGIKDYDLAYFDGSDLSYDAEDAVIRRVKGAFDEPLRGLVEVRNQARVHLWFEGKFGEPYRPLSCTAEALERFTSATFAVGVRLEPDDRLRIEALSVSPICLGCACSPILGEKPSASLGPAPMCCAGGPNLRSKTDHRFSTEREHFEGVTCK
jgi:uncharacterized protein